MSSSRPFAVAVFGAVVEAVAAAFADVVDAAVHPLSNQRHSCLGGRWRRCRKFSPKWSDLFSPIFSIFLTCQNRIARDVPTVVWILESFYHI